MPYKVCIFDLDGTLTDPKAGVTNGFKYALDYFGISEMPDNPDKYIGPPLHESFKKICGFNDEQTKQAVAKFREYYGQTGLYENEVYPGISELLEFLKSKDCITAVATSKYIEYAGIVLEHFGLKQYINYISGDTADGSLSKNGKGRIINIALEALGIDRKAEKSSIVMIGDRNHDIFGARDAGIDSIGVLWGYGTYNEFADAGATYIAQNTNELLDIIMNQSSGL